MSGPAPWQVTVVVAAYNEAQALPMLHPRIIAALDALEDVQGRVLYVDDGSRDATWSVLRTLAANDARVSVMRLSRNFGKEAALTAGLDRVDAVRASATDTTTVMLTGGRELVVRGAVEDVLATLRLASPVDVTLPVTALGLSARASLALDGIGVRTIRDLVGRTPADVLRGHGCGPQTLSEIKNKLAECGLALRDGAST